MTDIDELLTYADSADIASDLLVRELVDTIRTLRADRARVWDEGWKAGATTWTQIDSRQRNPYTVKEEQADD